MNQHIPFGSQAGKHALKSKDKAKQQLVALGGYQPPGAWTFLQRKEAVNQGSKDNQIKDGDAYTGKNVCKIMYP